jgi:hypothetical protein
MATTKIRLLPNGHPADYYCNQCRTYFNGPDGPRVVEKGGTYKVISLGGSSRTSRLSTSRRRPQ